MLVLFPAESLASGTPRNKEHQANAESLSGDSAKNENSPLWRKGLPYIFYIYTSFRVVRSYDLTKNSPL
jgi:hypothetical protein